MICGLHPREHVTVELCTRWAALASESINFLIIRHPLRLIQQCERLDEFGEDLNRDWPVAYTPNKADILRHLKHYDAVLSIHSGAEAVVIPYDDGTALSKEERRRLVDFGSFLFPWLPIGTCAEMLNYTASGTLTDFAYRDLHVPLVLTVEIYTNTSADNCWSFFNPTDTLEKYDPALNRLVQWTKEK